MTNNISSMKCALKSVPGLADVGVPHGNGDGPRVPPRCLEESGKTFKWLITMWKTYSKLEQCYGKQHNTIAEWTLKLREKANFVPTSNADWELSTEAINLKPMQGTATELEFFGEVDTSHKFSSPEAPNKKNQRVSSSVFSVSSYILVLRLRCNGKGLWKAFFAKFAKKSPFNGLQIMPEGWKMVL